ncbi:hypothetical protein [Qipengyuania sp. MTN3-11]|uniref:hypothetical protein n=1 Tax=Qipengyuania sp. MTN3-11 TaxID=3056557 RepID=UPI0036F1AFAD
MRIKTVAFAAAALGLASAPVLAAERQSAPIQGEQDLVGVSPVLLVLAAAAVIGGIILIADDDDEPVSP